MDYAIMIGLPNAFRPVDSNLSSGNRNLMFEQPGPEPSVNHVFLSLLTMGANFVIRVYFVYLKEKMHERSLHLQSPC